MKRLICIILCGVLSISLCACGVKDTDFFIDNICFTTSKSQVEEECQLSGNLFSTLYGSNVYAAYNLMQQLNGYDDTAEHIAYLGEFLNRVGSVYFSYDDKGIIEKMYFVYYGSEQTSFRVAAKRYFKEIYGNKDGEEESSFEYLFVPNVVSFMVDSCNWKNVAINYYTKTLGQKNEVEISPFTVVVISNGFKWKSPFWSK